MESFEKTLLLIAFGVLFLAVVWGAVRLRLFYKREHMVCPKCGYRWKPSPWKLIFSVHDPIGNVMRYPGCGAKEYMEPERDPQGQKEF